MSGTVFELRGVRYRYRDQPALAGVDLCINGGERVALLGPNGSGKSTLLRLLDALCFADGGQALAFGQPLDETRFRENEVNFGFRRRVGLVFQNPDIQLFNPTVFDEIAFGPLQLGWEKPRILAAAKAIMARFEIEALKDRPPHRLSGGEKKRVALASVLITEPDVLLLDEPTAALDPKSRDQLVHLLSSRTATAQTIITATHDLDAVRDIADRIVVMFEGRVLGDGRTGAVLEDADLLHRARLTHTHVHAHADGAPHAHHHIHMPPHRR